MTRRGVTIVLAFTVLASPLYAQGSTTKTPTKNQTLNAYLDQARQLGNDGKHVDALAVLARGAKEHPEVNAESIERWFGVDRARYRMVGNATPPIVSPHWMNAAPGTSSYSPKKGKVTVIEFTAHWCGPCVESYPTINAILKGAGERLDLVLVTELYGTFKGKSAKAGNELVAAEMYYHEKISGKFVLSVSDQPPPPTVPGVYGTVNTSKFAVGPLPQLMVIDRRGVIRRILVGWDDAQPRRLQGIVNALLAEK